MLKNVLFLLTRREKRRGALVLAMVIVMAALETAGVASVMPFLSVLGNPETIQENRALAWAYDAFGFESVDAFLFALGAASFSLIVVGAAFRILTHYAMNRFIEMRRHTLSERLLETYLRQPYEYFLNRHSGDMAKSILSEVDQVILNVFRPGMMMVAYSVVALGLVALMVVIDPILAAGVALVVGGAYGLIYLCVRGVLSRVGRERVRANRERFEAAGEALGGIKDIKLLGREHAYLKRFHRPSMRQARTQATNQTTAQVPRFAIEAVAFSGIIAITLALLAARGGPAAFGELLPILGVYAFAAYRLLPAAQRGYQGAAKLRFAGAAVDGIHDDLRQRTALAEIVPERAIALEGVSYH